MEIQPSGGPSAPRRVEPRGVAGARLDRPAEAEVVRDRVEISSPARLLELLASVPAVRAERVEALRRLIDAGEFETPERIEGAVRQLMEEFGIRDPAESP
jgi:hypothetical protein